MIIDDFGATGMAEMVVGRLLRDESGATAIEYGLISAVISIALLTGLGLFANNLQSQFNALANYINY